MRKSVYRFALAAIMTVADVAVFIHCLPAICAAWGTNRVVMASTFTATFILTNSLANLWRAAHQSLRAEASTNRGTRTMLPSDTRGRF